MGKIDFSQIGQNAIGDAVQGAQSGILGMVLGGYNDKRQIKQQTKLQDLQIKGSKELTDYQFAKELEMWNNTNYGAQMKQLAKAGLNPGLIYGMGGAGGATTGGGGMQPTGATASQAAGGEFGIAMQMGMMAAQKRLLQAQAANLEADTANKPKVGENIQADTTLKLEGVENAKVQRRVMNLDADLKEVQNEIANKTKDQAIELIDTNLEQAHSEAERMFRQNLITKAQMNDLIDQASATLAKTWAEKKLTDAATTTEKGKPAVQSAEIMKMGAEVMAMARAGAQKWRELEIAGGNANTNRETLENKMVEEYNNIPKDLIKDIINIIILRGLVQPQPGATPVKGFHDR